MRIYFLPRLQKSHFYGMYEFKSFCVRKPAAPVIKPARGFKEFLRK